MDVLNNETKKKSISKVILVFIWFKKFLQPLLPEFKKDSETDLSTSDENDTDGYV